MKQLVLGIFFIVSISSAQAAPLACAEKAKQVLAATVATGALTGNYFAGEPKGKKVAVKLPFNEKLELERFTFANTEADNTVDVTLVSEICELYGVQNNLPL